VLVNDACCAAASASPTTISKETVSSAIGVNRIPSIPMLQKTQAHVDYRIMITESGETLFQTPNLIHTSEGIINGFKFEFPQDGTYNMKIGIEGIFLSDENILYFIRSLIISYWYLQYI
jgi:hypothetical protein